MKNVFRKVAFTWIAVMGIIGLYKERQARLEHKEKNAPQQKEIVLDEFELASYHNS